jgi:uncharacterized protein (TIGR03083 family)
MQLAEFDAHRSSVRTQDGEIAYVDVGEGSPAVFVHGVFMNAALWRNVIGEVCGERRCIAIDLPAHGRTNVRPDADLSIGGLAAIVERTLDALSLDTFDLVANDTGGGIAQILAARAPQRLRTLTLTNCDTEGNTPPPNFAGFVDMAKRGELAAVVLQMAADPDVLRSNAGLGVGYEHADELTDEVVLGYAAPYSTEDGARALERFIASLSDDDLVAARPGLEKLGVPTLIVWGTGDRFFELKWAHWLKDTIPGATKLVEIEGARLFFPDERGVELAAHVRRAFMLGRRLSRSGSGTGAERVRVEIDPDAMLAAFVRHRRRFADAVAALDENALAQPSRCSEWTVADVLRHSIDTDGWMRDAWEGRPPPYTDPAFDPAASPQELIRAQRDVADVDVRDRFVSSSYAVADEVEASGRDRLDDPSVSPIGDVSWWMSMLHHFFDSLCHERDILVALGQTPPEVADETVPVFAYVLALAGLTVADPMDVTIRGVRLVTGNGPPVATPVEPRADVADVIDALSGRASLDEVLSDVDPDVVGRLSILPRLIAGVSAGVG